MISQDLMDTMACPLNPSQTKLTLDGDHLRCDRCGLRFRIKDGFPDMLVDEAELPAGCESTDDLPCEREARAARGMVKG